ncbi:MAG: two-component regulator propeller domain-containing protein, partial [Christiangramia sp.]|nr:two-component regulator propeller domain-containing protein [Christiangramia sp.]
MKKAIYKYLFLVGASAFFSCNDAPEAPEFPEMELGYEQPVAKPFRMPEPDTIIWEEVKLKPLPEKKFDWDKLPTKSFEIGESLPVESEITTRPFYLDSLPSSPFDLEKLPGKQIEIKVVELGDPDIREAGSLVKQPGTSRGVLTSNFNFGLSGNPMNIVKDKEGMLWIGTNYGLARYDSENIEMYGAEQGLNIPVLTALMQDSKGRIWVASNDRIMVLDLDKKLILELQNLYGRTPIFGFEEDSEGRVWASDVATGYSIIDLNERLVRYFNDTKENLEPFVTPLQDDEGLLWLTSRNSVRVIDLKEKITYLLKNDLLVEPSYHVNQGPSKKIWITNGNHITAIDKDDHKMVHLPVSKDTLNISDYVYEDKKGNIWTILENGTVKKFTSNLENFEEIIVNPSGVREVYFPML